MRDKGITSEGLIDAQYVGSINAVLFNHTNKVVRFERGQKITQLVIQPCETTDLDVVDELEETDRGGNGFGSTGF
jgi:dUTP pyrophosphatase